MVLTFKKLFSFRPNREALVAGAVGYNVDNVNEVPRGKYSSGNAGNLSPTSLKSEDNDPAFWVPASVTSTAAIQQQVSNTTEESAPPTPRSPTGSLKSNTLSYCSTTSVPIARSDKHVVLAMHPSRPRVSSMNAKLDHTKIDMTLYRSVSEEDFLILKSCILCFLFLLFVSILSRRLSIQFHSTKFGVICM